MDSSILQHLITQFDLPSDYANAVHRYIEPIADVIHNLAKSKPTPIIGINGSQGSGKTTAAQFLKALLETQYGHRVAVVSIDDFYHTKTNREVLAKNVHPLFSTRGVPGTHDVNLTIKTLKALKDVQKSESVSIPRFDKSTDDRKPKDQWDIVNGPISIIIFEGWCLGSPPMEHDVLYNPINNLEKTEDINARWRTTLNQYLSQEYQDLFKMIDWLLMLKAPGFDVVYEWRQLQEKKLASAHPEMDIFSKKHQQPINNVVGVTMYFIL